MKQRAQYYKPIYVIISIIILWEIIVRVKDIPLYVLPRPTDIVKALILDYSVLMQHAAITLSEAVLGMGIALIIAVILAIIMDACPIVKQTLYPILVVTQTVPMVVLTPIFIIYLGFGLIPKVLTVILMCFFPIVISFSEGMSELQTSYSDLVRCYGGKTIDIYRFVKLKGALPSLFAGLKVAATYSISGAVVGEWIASQSGLGYYLIRVKNAYMLDKVFACVVIIIVLSLMLNALVKLIEHLSQKRA